jgi:hypothetical protein
MRQTFHRDLARFACKLAGNLGRYRQADSLGSFVHETDDAVPPRGLSKHMPIDRIGASGPNRLDIQRPPATGSRQREGPFSYTCRAAGPGIRTCRTIQNPPQIFDHEFNASRPSRNSRREPIPATPHAEIRTSWRIYRLRDYRFNIHAAPAMEAPERGVVLGVWWSPDRRQGRRTQSPETVVSERRRAGASQELGTTGKKAQGRPSACV